MSAFVKTRDSALNAIKRYMTKSNDEAFVLDLENVESYLQLLNEQWVRFKTAQDEVELSCGADNIDVEQTARIQAETWYVTALSQFRRVQKCRTESVANSTNPHPTVSAAIKLPKMELPSFAGNSTEWIAFYDAFVTLVDSNSSLSGGQKLHYLRSCLKGDALSIISGFQICDANYTEAWNLLKSRYKVMRVIVEAHFRAIAEIRKSTSDTADSIKNVLNAFQQHIRELKALGRPVDFWDDWLVHETVTRLSYETRKQWELSLTSDDPPTFEDLSSFLEIRCRSLSMISTPATQSWPGKPNNQKLVGKSAKVFHATADQSRCTYCNAGHRIYSCEKFRSLDANARLNFVKDFKACLNCLSTGHFKERCNSASSCRICRQRHHTLLHSSPEASTSSHVVDSPRTAAGTLPAASLLPQTAVTSASACLNSKVNPMHKPQNAVLLSTALVKVRDSADRWQNARLLFDSGSHATFITEACVQRLGLARKSSSIFVTGIGASQGGRCRGETTLFLSSRHSSECYPINALILQKITGDLPSQSLSVPEWSHIKGLFLADPHFMEPGRVDILVGMDYMDRFILTELRKGPPGTPIIQKTVFGWTLCGNVDTSVPPANHIQSLHCDVHLDRALARLWELEEAPQTRYLTHEERYCEEHFESTHIRKPDGRFVVELPLKVDVPLGESRSLAVRNLLRMELRFAGDQDLWTRYNEFMQELIEMGHMEVVPKTNYAKYYMPHHAVVKESSVTTKLRVVFNASAKTTTGNSLNDALYVGPQLQEDLYSILLRFRMHKFAVTADVAKMYRQICVSAKHVDLHRIVWRSNPSLPITDYRMLRVTYGIASASHLAVKSMQQTAKQSSNTFQKAVDVILKDFYMDDLLTGASSKSELKALQRNVSDILREGGFELRKWASNCTELNETIARESKNISHYTVDGNNVHALGLIWYMEEDYFTFFISLGEPPHVLTKRAFLDDASKLFDPLSLLSPATIRSKMLFQDIWRSNTGWDDPVPDTIGKVWLDHRSQLQLLSELKVNRWVGVGTIGSFTELHVFADASERAYAAVIYARTVHRDGHITIGLISSKTKVAPLKTTTLPRLELCAAHLAAKLVKAVMQSWKDFCCPLVAWTDSTITLAWLQAHPNKWETFVANRVAYIHEVLPPECWNHIRSESNPADCASRGISPLQLMHHELWWFGPDFLREEEQFWKQPAQIMHKTEIGLRKVKACIAVTDVHWPPYNASNPATPVLGRWCPQLNS
ncbi:uncharacterized protein LOC128860779 [Anastrepha ludens]|uniref:uncharacterized protein LOC128860779 n=1 Tax=Anastrepha ludens TaxID=28586 RepID=UPI0023B17E61|nr:uncharacterized protein LOC128860779 [Anastrepha ludens]